MRMPHQAYRRQEGARNYVEPVPSFLSIDFIEGGGKKRGI
jgi:hypothetical protein